MDAREREQTRREQGRLSRKTPANRRVFLYDGQDVKSLRGGGVLFELLVDLAEQKLQFVPFRDGMLQGSQDQWIPFFPFGPQQTFVAGDLPVLFL